MTIRVHEQLMKNFPEFNLHPEVQKNLEKLEYHLNYNIPIDKHVLIYNTRSYSKLYLNYLPMKLDNWIEMND